LSVPEEEAPDDGDDDGDGGAEVSALAAFL
jgi:hypothetical protein